MGWTNVGNIRGATGSKGDKGDTGDPGVIILDAGDPDPSPPLAGVLYLRKTS